MLKKFLDYRTGIKMCSSRKDRPCSPDISSAQTIHSSQEGRLIFCRQSNERLLSSTTFNECDALKCSAMYGVAKQSDDCEHVIAD